jgi:hypothetical protein
MPFNTLTLIWLFPLAFSLHDLEELLFFEPWLIKNAGLIMERVRGRLPAFLERQLETVLHKSTAQFAIPIGLNCILACLSSFLAVQFGKYVLFLMASSLFFVHGFMHIGQAILLRKYIPALVTSILIVLPYGIILFPNLLASRITTLSGLLVYCAIGIIIAVPFILLIHAIGEILEKGFKRLANQ